MQGQRLAKLLLLEPDERVHVVAMLHQNRLAVPTITPLDIIGHYIEHARIMTDAGDYIVWRSRLLVFSFFSFLLLLLFIDLLVTNSQFFLLLTLILSILFDFSLFCLLLCSCRVQRLAKNVVLLHPAVESMELALI